MNHLIIVALTILLLGQNPPKDKPQAAHEAMNARGEHAMGFSQTATTHHFLLSDAGGTIQVKANDAADKSSIDTIRMHLAHISKMFAAGEFTDPMFVHATVPPGVPEMKRLKADIHYAYEDVPAGGHLVISTNNKTAIDAVHKFLRFQIQEHKTGDPQ